MSSDRQVPKDSKPKVPSYIVTFSDMVTLLLTFFVMLLCMATTSDPEMYNISRDAFVEHINTFGLGMLSGTELSPDFRAVKVKHFIENSDEIVPVRTIDVNEENVRRIFKKVAQTMTTQPSQIVAKKTNFSVTNIVFSSGEAVLNTSAEKFLTQFAMNLQQDNGLEKVKLYVLGLACDEKTEKRRWILSAERAQSVAEFLNGVFPAQFHCPVYSWGAGSGGEWVNDESAVSEESQILIAVLRAND